jgi:phosphonate transport system permease protein
MTASLSPSLAETVTRSFARKRAAAFGVPLLILAYLTYAAISFDVAGLWARARMDNAVILMSDFWSHKTHVTRDNRTGELVVAIEGENKGTYAAGAAPAWVQTAGDVTTIDLGLGHVVTYDDAGARYVVPGYGTIDRPPANPRLDQRCGKQGVSENQRRPFQLFAIQGGNLQISGRVGAVVLYPRQPVLWQILWAVDLPCAVG